MTCGYAKSWGCCAAGTFSVGGTTQMCMPHAVLYLWLIYGDGDPIERLPEHDRVAKLPVAELELVLRTDPVWVARVAKVLKEPAS